MDWNRATSEIIVAPATATGGALSLLRLSGEGTIALCESCFRGRCRLGEAPTHTLHYGEIVAEDGALIDDVVLSLFRAPHSYTGEESVEISCHGSAVIVAALLDRLIALGARMAEPGEFTRRAYLAGRLDLSQAEAVADLIAARSEAALRLARQQMRGDYSSSLEALRVELLRLSALVELELDFSEEDVEFADRGEVRLTMEGIRAELLRLEESFRVGNALREGVPVAIVGAPNVGKSTLLNRLVGDDRALVSEIAGTTRDTIEERVRIEGVEFCFIDTAGLHDTEDSLERMGIDRTHAAIERAAILLQVVDIRSSEPHPITPKEGQRALLLFNKSDLLTEDEIAQLRERYPEALFLSAKLDARQEPLRQALRRAVDTSALERGDTIVSNGRHRAALYAARVALERTLQALDEELPTDLLAEELRQVAHYVGTITGSEISSSEVLQMIFSKFCIGK